MKERNATVDGASFRILLAGDLTGGIFDMFHPWRIHYHVLEIFQVQSELKIKRYKIIKG